MSDSPGAAALADPPPFPAPPPLADAAAVDALRGPGASDDAPRLRRRLRRLRRRMAPGQALELGPAPLSSAAAARLREAGFAVSAADGRPPAVHALAAPPGALAVAGWGTPPGVRLDLRYASDEAALLDPSPMAVWERVIRGEERAGARVVEEYAVDDPYGGERAAPALSRFFEVPLEPGQVTFGAGVSALLHALAALADGGVVLAPELVHPDLEAWALRGGSEVRLVPGPAAGLAARVAAEHPALVHLDRPDFVGATPSLAEVEALARAAARVGAVVVVDESPAPYLGPHASAARLAARCDNLVVLRGFTKAYSWGGLRAGFAVASRGVALEVRELVPPMQVGPLALRAALALLAAGDVFARLRQVTAIMKPLAAGTLEAAGLAVLPGPPELPWLGVRDPGGAASRWLEARGVFALRPALAPVFPPPDPQVLRLTVPLSEERMERFRVLLA